MRGILLVSWVALRLAAFAITVAYFVLAFIAARRFSGRKRARSTDAMFWLIVVLASIRVLSQFMRFGGWSYRLVVVLPGIAALIGIPGLLKELGSLRASVGNPTDSDGARIS